MKQTILMLTFFVSNYSNAQIMLRGYKCLFPEDYSPGSSELYQGNDTFQITSFHKDIYTEPGDTYDDPKKRLKAGLSFCFYKRTYFKTKDSLYICTGKYDNKTCYYEIYVPEYEESFLIKSNINDANFSDKSKWLLSQIRFYRGKPLYFTNEKHETCLDENHPYQKP